MKKSFIFTLTLTTVLSFFTVWSVPSYADDELSTQYGFSKSEIGSYVVFGKYEQDNDPENGKEDIEWLVLAKEKDKILVISKYGLDCQPYNTSYVPKCTWEICTLRKWLNDSFLKTAFTPEEAEMIQCVTVSAEKNPSFAHSRPGNDTQDQIFLLSCSEASNYFESDDARMCIPTPYAIAQGVYAHDEYTVDGKAACHWSLRTPGRAPDYASGIWYDGRVGVSGREVDRADGAVRPALWISHSPK